MPRDFSLDSSRSLQAFDLVGLYNGCPQGQQALNTMETNTNPPDWWETNWGRTGETFPRLGFQECWDNRGSVCALPQEDHVVCLPGSKRGSTANKGWALDPKGQSCQPGVHCLYACEPGYYWTMFNQSETSNFDSVNGPKKGHCDGTWDYGTSTHGVFCKEDGALDIPAGQPLCQLGETYVYAENHLDTHIFLCQTVFPGHEIFLIPTLVKPGESVMITTQPADYWHGPTYQKPTHGDFYVSFAGADIMEACTWDEISPSGASMLPYEIGSGVEDNGFVYSTHYYYQQPNSEIPAHKVGYQMDLVCESSEPGVCGPVFRNADVVKADVLKKPRPGTTKVKFVFTPDTAQTHFPDMYRETSQVFLDPNKIPEPTARGHGGVARDPAPVGPPGNDSFKDVTSESQEILNLPQQDVQAPVKLILPNESTQQQLQHHPTTPSAWQYPQQPKKEPLPEPIVQPQQPQPVPQLPQPEATQPPRQVQGGTAVCIGGICYNSMPEHMKGKQQNVVYDPVFDNGDQREGAKGLNIVNGEDVRYVADSLQGSHFLPFGRN